MIASLRFIFLVAFLCAPAVAQVPPGFPYDPARHANPILTYVANADFQQSSYEAAVDAADIELLGLSLEEAKRETIELARTSLRRIRIGARDAEVTFYPVVRQTFSLASGGQFVLHSFKFPRVPIPPDIAAQVLNEVALTKPRRPEDARFGKAEAPAMLQLRGADALLFDEDGELTVFWVEDGVAHTAAAKLPQEDLFRFVEDLL